MTYAQFDYAAYYSSIIFEIIQLNEQRTINSKNLSI